MPLIYVIGVLIVVGVLLWLVNNYIPMDGKIKSILNAVVVIAVVVYLLQVFGVLGSLESIKSVISRADENYAVPGRTPDRRSPYGRKLRAATSA
jgi:hypothetical protein